MTVFVKKDRSSRLSDVSGLCIRDLIGHRKTDGEIGLEIEVEGNKFPKQSTPHSGAVDAHLIPDCWKYTHDGSLRGNDNAEYVFKAPLPFELVPEAVNSLWDMFANYGTMLDESNRTSVHVHLNVQEWHLNRLCSFLGMYFVIEDLLTHWAGDHRVGNLFCLRAKDARAIISNLKGFFRADGYGWEFPNGMHYAGLNAGAIYKFGSVEIRALRGVTDPTIILDWVAVLERLYKLSEDFPDPRSVVAGFSGSGPISWLENILGDKFGTIVNNVPMTTDEVRESLYEGIRLAQDLCYCRDWSEYEPRKMSQDPFGRKIKTAGAATMMAQYHADLAHYTAVISSPSPPTDMFTTSFEGEFVEEDYVPDEDYEEDDDE